MLSTLPRDAGLAPWLRPLPPHTFNTSQARLHERWAHGRASIIGALARCDEPEAEPDPFDVSAIPGPEPELELDALAKRAHRLCQCARFPSLRATSEGMPAKSLGRCRDRLCPYCAAMRAIQLRDSAERLIRKMKRPRHITLTLASSRRPLRGELDRLSKAFRELRRSRDWKARVKAGIYAVEATLNTNPESPNAGSFHPHLHVVFDGDYFDVKLLRSLWRRVTGDSFIADIEDVRNASKMAEYVAGYTASASKRLGSELSQNASPTRRLKDECVAAWSPAHVREYAEALHGRRLVHTFGKLHGAQLDLRDADGDDEKTSEHVIDVATLRGSAESGFAPAQTALEIMHRMGGTWARMAGLLPFREKRALPVTDAERCELVKLARETSVWLEAQRAAALAPLVEPVEPEPAPDPRQESFAFAGERRFKR